MADTFWRDAAKGGLIIGGIVAAALYIKAWLMVSESVTWFPTGLLEALAVGYFLYRMCRRRSLLHDAATGYSFGKNMGFVMALALFAGFIYGAAYYFLLNFAMPAFGDIMIEQSLQTAYAVYGGEMADMMESMVDRMFSNPLFWLFYAVLAMVFYCGIIGLIVSIFVKRKPDVFAGGQ